MWYGIIILTNVDLLGNIDFDGKDKFKRRTSVVIMKKRISLIMVLIMIVTLALAGCGGESENSGDAQEVFKMESGWRVIDEESGVCQYAFEIENTSDDVIIDAMAFIIGFDADGNEIEKIGGGGIHHSIGVLYPGEKTAVFETVVPLDDYTEWPEMPASFECKVATISYRMAQKAPLLIIEKAEMIPYTSETMNVYFVDESGKKMGFKSQYTDYAITVKNAGEYEYDPENVNYSIEYNGAYVCAVFIDYEGNITGGDFTMARDDDSGYIPALKPGESATIEVRVQNLTGGEPEFLICWN